MATRATTLVSLETAKEWLGVVKDDKDAVIQRLADSLSAGLERRTHRQFVTRTFTAELYNGSGRNVLRLRHYPVVSVATLTITREEGGTPETIASTDYDVDLPAGLVRMRDVVAPFTGGWQNVSVTYDAGEGAKGSEDLDAEAIGTYLDMLAIVWQRHISKAGMSTTINVNAGSMVMSEAWPPHIRQGLRSLTRPEVG